MKTDITKKKKNQNFKIKERSEIKQTNKTSKAK